MKKICISGCSIGQKFPPYIIAEMSGNHNGSLDLALQTIHAAKACGANAIKLQTYTPETMTIDCDKPDFQIKGGLWHGYNLYDLYKVAQTPYEWHEVMFDYARRIGITIFSTPFDESAVDFLEQLDAPAYKIASFENIDLPLIECVAKTGKPIIISTGMASNDEIGEAVETARSAGCKELALLHCISSYPTPVEHANLKKISILERDFKVISGLSDHTLGTAVSVAAVALGASIIEKHFIIDRENKGPDSEFSLEPDEFRCLTRDTRDIWVALGDGTFNPQKTEVDSRMFRRSIYFIRDIQAGAIVTKDDIRRIRPGMGLSPKYFDSLIGRRLRISVTRGTATSWEHFD